MTTALMLRPEPWAVEDPVLDCAIFILDMVRNKTLVEAVYGEDEARVPNENGQCFCPMCNARRVAWEAEVAEGGEQMTESSFKNVACRVDSLATTNEPTIMINGHVLTEAQAQTLRVAVESFAATLRCPEGAEELGPIGVSYLERVQEIRKLMYGGR